MKRSAKLLASYLVPLLVLFLVFFKVEVKANSLRPVHATVKISICGNGIKEEGEDCDNIDLDGQSCASLGFTGGSLSCNPACVFRTTSCATPTLNPTNVAPENLTSLLAAGYFSIPSSANYFSAPQVTVTDQVKINLPVTGGTCSVTLPKNLVIMGSGGCSFNPTALTTSTVATNSLSGFSQNTSVKAAMQWGMTSTSLQFNTPVAMSIFVGSSLDGQTLNVVRSASLDSGWTSEGIVPPATCLVTGGLCHFQVTKASYFATTQTISTPTPTPTATPTASPTASTSGSSSSSSNSSSGSTATTAATTPVPVSYVPESLLTRVLALFDFNQSGKIEKSEVFGVVKTWVDKWNGERQSGETKECDVNKDQECDLEDFSVLLFFVER